MKSRHVNYMSWSMVEWRDDAIPAVHVTRGQQYAVK